MTYQTKAGFAIRSKAAETSGTEITVKQMNILRAHGINGHGLTRKQAGRLIWQKCVKR